MSSRLSQGSIPAPLTAAIEFPWLQESALAACAEASTHQPEHSRVAGGPADNARTIASASVRNTALPGADDGKGRARNSVRLKLKVQRSEPRRARTRAEFSAASRETSHPVPAGGGAPVVS